MGKNSDYAAWFEYAQVDLATAQHCTQHIHQSLIQSVCFHCQQCAEKALKGFLVFHKITPRRTHDLSLLLNTCAEIQSEFLQLRLDCITLNAFASDIRYPNGHDIPGSEERRAVRCAQRIYEFVLKQTQS